MDKLITIYHGSEKNVEQPIFGEGKKNNDFGLGFYCTASEELAKEWAVSSLRDGFSNRYTLDTEYLNILNFNEFIFMDMYLARLQSVIKYANTTALFLAVGYIASIHSYKNHGKKYYLLFLVVLD